MYSSQFNQQQVSQIYLDLVNFRRMSILNVAHTDKFSSNRTIEEYAAAIWNAKPVQFERENTT
jgi:starch phosphorylase